VSADSRGVSAPAQATLAAAAFLGVREFYRVGGAQAIAALAYGTEEIPRVDKIVGPGNRYVTAAKKLVAFDCAIEFLAGPTEAVIISATAIRLASHPIWWRRRNMIPTRCASSSRPRARWRKKFRTKCRSARAPIRLPPNRSPVAAPFC
jgi:hypothetical protein